MTKTILIVATDKKGGIGYKGQLPWHCPSDLSHFRNVTMGHALVMGRATFESIGRPLPGRKTFVVSRTVKSIPGVSVFPTPQLAIEAARSEHDTVFVAGGGEIYAASIDECDVILRSIVHGNHQCDTFFRIEDYPEFVLKDELVDQDVRFQEWVRA